MKNDPAFHYELSPVEGEKLGELVFGTGDSGVAVLSSLNAVVDNVAGEEKDHPSLRRDRLRLERDEEDMLREALADVVAANQASQSQYGGGGDGGGRGNYDGGGGGDNYSGGEGGSGSGMDDFDGSSLSSQQMQQQLLTLQKQLATLQQPAPLPSLPQIFPSFTPALTPASLSSWPSSASAAAPAQDPQDTLLLSRMAERTQAEMQLQAMQQQLQQMQAPMDSLYPSMNPAYGTVGMMGAYNGAPFNMSATGGPQMGYTLADMAAAFGGPSGNYLDPSMANDPSGGLYGGMNMSSGMSGGMGGGMGHGDNDKAVVYQTVFQPAGPIGIAFSPVRLLYPGGAAYVAVITESPAGCPVTPGDVILSVNGNVLVGDERASPSIETFGHVVRESMATATPPRTLRLFRCGAVMQYHAAPGAPPPMLSADQASIFMQG